MLKKIQWHENLTVDEKIAVYKTVLDILESAGGSMGFNHFVENIFKRVDFSKLKNPRPFILELVQELIKRGYIRLELQDFYGSPFYLAPLVNVVRI